MFLDDALRRILHEELRTILREELANMLHLVRPMSAAPASADPDALLTVDDVADRCGVKPTTVRTWIKTGALIALRLSGRHYRMREADLATFLNEQGKVKDMTADVDASVARMLGKMHAKRA